MTLDNKCLRYYNIKNKQKFEQINDFPLSGFMPSTVTDQAADGCINFDLHKCKIEMISKRAFKVIVFGAERDFEF